MNATNELTEIFGEPISVYTRAQAIDDGFLVDISELAREAGFRYPVAMTSDAFSKYVEVPEEFTGSGQSVEGRAWDVINTLQHAIRRSSGGAKVRFQTLFAMPSAGGAGRSHTERATFICTVGPGDHAEPVMTIELA